MFGLFSAVFPASGLQHLRLGLFHRPQQRPRVRRHLFPADAAVPGGGHPHPAGDPARHRRRVAVRGGSGGAGAGSQRTLLRKAEGPLSIRITNSGGAFLQGASLIIFHFLTWS